MLREKKKKEQIKEQSDGLAGKKNLDITGYQVTSGPRLIDNELLTYMQMLTVITQLPRHCPYVALVRNNPVFMVAFARRRGCLTV